MPSGSLAARRQYRTVVVVTSRRKRTECSRFAFGLVLPSIYISRYRAHSVRRRVCRWSVPNECMSVCVCVCVFFFVCAYIEHVFLHETAYARRCAKCCNLTRLSTVVHRNNPCATNVASRSPFTRSIWPQNGKPSNWPVGPSSYDVKCTKCLCLYINCDCRCRPSRRRRHRSRIQSQSNSKRVHQFAHTNTPTGREGGVLY